MPDIYIVGTPSQAVTAAFFRATAVANDFRMDQLVLPTGESFAFAEEVRVPQVLTAPIMAGQPELKLVAAINDPGLTVRGHLHVSGAANPTIFGQRFDGTWGLDIYVSIHIPGPSEPPDVPEPFFRLTVWGRADLDAQGANAKFNIEALLFELEIRKLPAVLTEFEPEAWLSSPHFGLRVPRLRLPWTWPKFPELGNPFGGPVESSLGWNEELPFGCESIKLAPGEQAMVLEVKKARLGAQPGVIVGDLHLELEHDSGGNVIFQNTRLDLIRPQAVTIQLPHWKVGEETLTIGWTEKFLRAWLSLLSLELGSRFASNTDSDVKALLRLRWGVNGIEEARLDWQQGTDPLTLRPPGFEIDVPAVSFFTLLWHTIEPDSSDEPGSQLKLIATLPQNADVKARTAFTLFEDDSVSDDDNREAHHAPNGPSVPANQDPEPLLALSTKSKQAVSIVLLDLSISGDGHTRFFRQLAAPLDPLDLFASDAPTIVDTFNLDTADWEDPVVQLNANGLSLPFLRDLDGEKPRFIEVTGVQPHVRFADHEIDCALGLAVHLGSLSATGNVALVFDWERFAFRLKPGDELHLVAPNSDPIHGDFLGLDWTFTSAPDKKLFTLNLAKRGFALGQAKGSQIAVKFTRATAPGEAIELDVSGFALGAGGISLKAVVKPVSARFLGVDTHFRLDGGSFEIKDNRITDFTLNGSGDLPPALVGEAKAKVQLTFGQRDGRGGLRLLSASAQLIGRPRLICDGTRFHFSVEGFDLEFADDGEHQHFYFVVSGTARFTPKEGDDSSGPLAWLPRIEMRLINAPLCGDPSVLRKYIQFLVEMPRKPTFSFLGCFNFELRGIAFEPQTNVFGQPLTDAMRTSGQVKFSDSGGDALEVKIDFHNLFIGLPKPGDSFPRLHLKGLGVKVRSGDAFELGGEVDFLEGEIEPGVPGDGFAGTGYVKIQGLPMIFATFTFVRVFDHSINRFVRAWFLYAEARQMSLQIPDLPVWIRELGFGFGYRYTLAMIRTGDDVDDPRELLRILSEQAQTQGNLSRRDQWRLDLAGEETRFTIALRGLIAAASAAKSWNDWSETAETNLPCLALLDAVLALRSDLTFLMTARGWLFTNYRDFLRNDDIKDHPLISGFVYLSPRRRRFLAHVQSHTGAAFGDHPPLPFFLKEAIKQSRFSATLLIEPGLFHAELGWPNGLQWRVHLGPLLIECMGGMIIRVSTREFVQGTSLIAHGRLEIHAGVDLGSVGATLSVITDVRFGARYIFVVRFDLFNESALYSAIGVEILVRVAIDFWIKIDLFFGSITIHIPFSFEIQFTALVETAVASNGPGIRATGTIAVQLMGHSLPLRVHLGLNESAVNRAKEITDRYLNIGLEASEVERIPGEPASPGKALDGPGAAARNGTQVQQKSAAPIVFAATRPAAPLPDPTDHDFPTPSYQLVTSEPAEGDYFYALIVPQLSPYQNGQNQPSRVAFLPVPPDNQALKLDDLVWQAPGGNFGGLQRWHDGAWTPIADPVEKIQCEWAHVLEEPVNADGTPILDDNKQPVQITLAQWLRNSFLLDDQFSIRPVDNPHELTISQLAADQRDHRVRHPAWGSYESAVRGAAEQLFASPYLKRDPNIDYERLLGAAFAEDTTAIYFHDPSLDPLPGDSEDERWAKLEKAQKQRQAEQAAHEHRGTLLRELLEELQKYPKVEGTQEEPAFLKKALAFRLGLVCRVDRKNVPLWLRKKSDDLGNPIDRGQIQQRLRRTAPTLSIPKPVALFNDDSQRFDRLESAPTFHDVVITPDAGTIGIAWELRLPNGSDRFSPNDLLEDHLLYCHIERQLIDRPLGGAARAATGLRSFRVKVGAALARDDLKSGAVIAVSARFQFTDHFSEESPADLATLPPDGLRYRYVITPVDIAGRSSVRPFSVVTVRRPNVPPLVPADAELAIIYDMANFPPVQSGRPKVVKPFAIQLAWTEPEQPEGHLAAPVQNRFLIFRRERTLPLGRYPADAATAAPGQNGLATSQARRLPGDIAVLTNNATIVAQSDPRRKSVEIDFADLPNYGIIDRDEFWRPEGWQLFIQTQGDNGIFSSLARVQLRLAFLGAKPVDPTKSRLVEERHPAWLEFIAYPLQPAVLPGRDAWVRNGTLTLPFPPAGKIDLTTTPVLTLKPDSTKQQALGFDWNQGSTAANAPPAEIQAGYALYEYDLDEHTAEILEQAITTDGKTAEVLALSRRIQNVELMAPWDRLITPPDNNAADQWDAWYPSLRARIDAKLGHDVPRRTDATHAPWHSWSGAQLVWPKVETGSHPWHPLFDEIITEFETSGDFTVEVLARTAVDNTDREKFVAATSPPRDPVGWTILKTLGLSLSFLVRQRATGSPADPEKFWPDLRTAIKTVLDASGAGNLRRHLFLECLLQPGKALHLEGDAIDALHDEDSLGIVQLSLRPVFDATWEFVRYDVPGRVGRLVKLIVEGATGTVLPFATVTARLAGGGHVAVDVAPGNTSIPAPDQTDPGLDPTQLLARGGDVLIVRGRPDFRATIKHIFQKPSNQNGATDLVGDGAIEVIPPTEPPLPVTSWLRTEFELPKPAWFTKDEVEIWEIRLSGWLETLRPDAPSKFAIPKALLEKGTANQRPNPEFVEAVVALRPWLDRFFTAGPGGKDSTDGPWLASAAPRRVAPVPAETDEAGRLHLAQPLGDAWAHAFRFFIVPETRYDALWKALASSERLFPPEAREDAMKSLEKVARLTADASLDITLPRLKRIPPPALRGSRMVEAADGSGSIWEIDISQHPEQSLSERNRSLAQHLEFVQLAASSGRRYGFQEAFTKFHDLSGGKLEPLIVEQDPATVSLPGDYAPPQDVPTDKLRDEIDLPKRFDPRVEPAMVIQWKGLLFFYEYRATIIAQAASVVSESIETRQRDGRSQTPQKPADTCQPQAEGFIDGSNERWLTIVWRLASHWDCLPEDLKKIWLAEAPAVQGKRRTFSSLPDPEVAYLVRLERPSGLGEAQGEIKFDTAQPCGYYATPAPRAAFTPEVLEVTAPAVDALDWRLRLGFKQPADSWPTTSEPVTSRLDFQGSSPTLTFAWPGVWMLRLIEALTDAEIVGLRQRADALAATAPSADAVTAAAALRELLARLAAAGTLAPGTPLQFVVPAPPGLDQLAELCPLMSRDDLPTAANKAFTWRGPASDEQTSVLTAWRDSLPSGSPERTALSNLLAALPGNRDVTINLNDAWTPRPWADDLAAISADLPRKLLLGRGSLSVPGPMTRSEANVLIDQAAAKPISKPANEAAVRRLFTRSLEAPAPSTTWKLHLRRASLVEENTTVPLTLP